MTLSIQRLEARPNEVATVASWIDSEWGQLPIHEYFAAIKSLDTERHHLPQTLIASFENGTVGTVSILLDDLETRPELNPWIGCLYVLPSWRRKGIGTTLLQAAEREASLRFHIERIYLFTELHAALYSKNGWSVVETDKYQGKIVTIMVKSISAPRLVSIETGEGC